MYENDIPLSLAVAAFSGVSFNPDGRGARTRSEYAAALAEDLALFQTQAKKGGTEDKVDEVFARYRGGLRRCYTAYLASSSRCVSSFIAGPSNFPVRRMQKRNDVAHKRLGELVNFREIARRHAIRELRPDLRPIMAGDADAIDRLAAKLATAVRDQEHMKAANAAIRKHRKEGEDAQVAALMDLGEPEAIARALLKGDFCGRIGYADYQLTNNSANIRRMRERLQQLERDHAQPVREAEGNGVKMEDDPPANRVRLFFPDKPDLAVRTKLRTHGFRWAPTLGAWQAYRNHNTLQLAGSFVAPRGV